MKWWFNYTFQLYTGNKLLTNCTPWTMQEFKWLICWYIFTGIACLCSQQVCVSKLGMGYVMFLSLRLKHHSTQSCNVLYDFETLQKIICWLLVSKSSTVWDCLYFMSAACEKGIGTELETHKIKIVVTYMSDNFMIVKWANEYLNYALLLMHCHLEFIL